MNRHECEIEMRERKKKRIRKRNNTNAGKRGLEVGREMGANVEVPPVVEM
jgi:hypothetical protein